MLGLDHAALVSNGKRMLNDTEADRVTNAGWGRLAGQPVSRITGKREFWGLPFVINSLVLDPRPDTETVVEFALELLDRDGPRTRPLRIADLGVGSGAILLALLSELPNARGIGTDITQATLEVARSNARALGLNARADFVASDFGDALKGPFDLVVSNPPYIPTAEIKTLAHEVREYDPRHALNGGPDGLAAYQAIAADAPRLIGSSGHLVIEIGQGQADDATALFRAQGLAVAPPRPDLAGIPRALAARQAR
jgi:release factor glutamine methyltransferase